MSLNLRNFLITLTATVIWFFLMRPFTPPNIVAFELAGTVEAASLIINSWSTEQIDRVKTSIYLDFGFILAYCSAFMFACKVASNYSGVQFFSKTGRRLVVLIWIAGLCDAIENTAMLKTLREISSTTVSIAFYTATVKFGILLLALIFVLMCVIAGLFTRKSTT